MRVMREHFSSSTTPLALISCLFSVVKSRTPVYVGSIFSLNFLMQCHSLGKCKLHSNTGARGSCFYLMFNCAHKKWTWERASIKIFNYLHCVGTEALLTLSQCPGHGPDREAGTVSGGAKWRRSSGCL